MKLHGQIVSAFLLLLTASGVASGQTTPGKFSFEVATVKPAAPLDMQ